MEIQNASEKQPSVLRKYGVMLIKILLAGGIVFWLIKSNYSNFKRGLEVFNYYWLIPAFGAYFSHMFFAGWRWYELAKILKIDLSMNEAVAVTFQSYFWSLVIPGGAIGGDVARVAIITRRQPPGSKAEGVLTILMDRIVGMVALFVLTLVLIAISIPQLMRVTNVGGIALNDHVKILIIIGLVLLCLSGIAAMLALFFHRQLCKIKLFDYLFKLGDRYSHGMVERLKSAIDLYAKSWRSLAWLTVVSVFTIHIMTVIAVLFMVYGLDINPIPKVAILTAVTIGNIVGLIPLTLSGIGLRDVVILALLQATNMSGNIVIVPVMYTMLIVVANLCCSGFFIFGSTEKKSGEYDK